MFAMFLQSNDGQVCPRNSQQHSQKPKYESIYSDCIPLWRLAVRYWRRSCGCCEGVVAERESVWLSNEAAMVSPAGKNADAERHKVS